MYILINTCNNVYFNKFIRSILYIQKRGLLNYEDVEENLTFVREFLRLNIESSFANAINLSALELKPRAM